MLKWGIENSDVSRTGETSDAPKTSFDPDAMAALMSMRPPSDAELMTDRMAIVADDKATIDARLAAFDDFEQLIEGLDNANNLQVLHLWDPLVKQLDHAEAKMRKYAAWCIGTAVENNARSQERVSRTTSPSVRGSSRLTPRSCSSSEPSQPSSDSQPKTQARTFEGRLSAPSPALHETSSLPSMSSWTTYHLNSSRRTNWTLEIWTLWTA